VAGLRKRGRSEAERLYTGRETKKRDKCEAELWPTLVGRETGMKKRDRHEGQRQD
jgi:hypothetical protein